jgi:hypothetical protein
MSTHERSGRIIFYPLHLIRYWLEIVVDDWISFDGLDRDREPQVVEPGLMSVQSSVGSQVCDLFIKHCNDSAGTADVMASYKETKSRNIPITCINPCRDDRDFWRFSASYIWTILRVREGTAGCLGVRPHPNLKPTAKASTS